MIKADIVNRVAEHSDLPRVKAAHAVDTILGAMKNALGDGSGSSSAASASSRSAAASAAWGAIRRPASR